MENAEKFKHIKGWGIDADPRNEPTYPVKKYTGDDHKRLNYEKPTEQPVDVEILYSNERPSVTSVFGTSTPPSGLSGMIRRLAFRYSEGSFGHWIPLLFADRINVIEGLISDITRGKIPNIFAERGWKAELRYNKANFLTRSAVKMVVAGLVLTWILSGRKKKKIRKR